jgi:heme exporter protein B
MKGLLGPMTTMIWKDIVLEVRSRELVVSVIVFGLLVVIVFSFALDPEPGRSARLAPGILWVAFAFAATLAMNRAFVREQEAGALEGLLLSPVSRDAIFLAKAATSFIFMLLVEAALLPAYAVMLDFSAFSWALGATIVLATLGFSLIGTLFSALAAQTRSREIMLPVLFFPIVLPVILAAVEASTRAVGGETFVGLGRWLPLIGIFDALFLVICPWVFSFVVED